MELSLLQELPPGIEDSETLLSDLDELFRTGFARLSDEAGVHLQTLEAAFAGTPFAEALADALRAIAQHEFLEHHFAVVALARASLQGAQHDSLRAQACGALGKTIPSSDAPTPSEEVVSEPQIELWCESIRQWLMELALTGFAHLDSETMAAFFQSLEEIQRDPRMMRHAALLNGWLREMLAVHEADEIPLRRWVDMWTRAFVLSTATPDVPSNENGSGSLYILACELQQHDVSASLCVHAYLAPQGSETKMLCRIRITTFKVDVIVGAELRELFVGIAPKLLAALSEERVLELDAMPITPTGDILWDDGRARLGESSALLEAFPHANTLTSTPLAAADRMPAMLFDICYLDDYRIKDDNLFVGDAILPLAWHYVAETQDMPEASVRKSTAMLAALRFDAGRWCVQPLSIVSRVKKLDVVMTQGRFTPGKGKKPKPALPLLQERASRLLRKKASS